MRRFTVLCFLLLFSILALSEPAPVRADYKQAVAFYSQGQYEKAIQELQPDLDRNPDWEFGHRLLGLCYLNLQNNALAASSLSRAVQLKSTAFPTYFGLGQAYFNMQKYKDCIEALNRGEPLAAKEKDPEAQKARLFRLRGSAHYRLNNFTEAVSDLTQALRLSQSDWSDFAMLGISYFNLDRTDEAIETLEKAYSMKLDQTTILEVLAKSYLKKGITALSEKQFNTSVKLLKKGLDYDPANGYIHYNLAEAYLFQKQYPNAEKALNQAAALMPQKADVYERLGLVYEKQKKWDAALNAYKEAQSIEPSDSIKEAIERVTENKKQ
ncbi:MAG: tetratricopeptide repeat protein [Acidobacteria bacterium]|nr:tetratricopeptide repeat protein [Acidobacteriota bacterium]